MEGTDLQQRFASLAAGILCLHDPNGHGRRMVAELFKQRPLRLCSDPNFADLLGAALDANSLSDPDQWELAREAVTALVPRGGERPRLLDFGCGVKSDHRLTLESFGYEWNGLELAGTLDAGTQAGFDKLASDSHVTLYDGAGIPFPGASFQVVFSNQSLEHVDDVDHAMHEIARILRPGGLLIGSVSQLEPYHGYSTFNYTPYGLALLGRRHGLALERCTPGIDSLTLIARILFCSLGQDATIDQVFTHFYAKPPLNGILDEIGTATGLSIRDINALKLRLCAQFRFRLRKSPRLPVTA